MSRVGRLGPDAAEAIRATNPDAQGWRIATIWIESVPHPAGLLLDSNAWAHAPATI